MRMLLVRSNMRLRLTTVSARARGAPGQAWRPRPNATCNRAFARSIWNSPGFSNLRESRLAALLAIYKKVPAGISTPPTWVGLFANRKSPLTGPSIRRHSSTKSEEHTSELQSRLHLVCRLLLEKKKKPVYQFNYFKKKKKRKTPT